MIKYLGLFCFLCTCIGIDVGAASERNTLVVSTEPTDVGIFHYLRGGHYFLGYTPFEITRNHLEGKDETRILLTKFGFKRILVDFGFDGKDRLYRLTPIKPPYVLPEVGTNLKDSECRIRISDKIEKMIFEKHRSQIDIELPGKWAEVDGRRKLVILAHLLNYDDIAAIKSAERRDKDEAITLVENLLKPISKLLIQELRNLECLENLLLIADYKGRGLKIDFSPYRQIWTAETSYRIGNTIYKVSVQDSSLELQRDMVFINNEKTYFFDYKLR